MNLKNDLLSRLASDISAEPMMAHLAEFSRWQKLAGSEEEATSLNYVRQQLDAYGLETTLLHHDAFISLPLDASLIFNGKEIRAITHSMALPSPEGGVTGKIIDLGNAEPANFGAKDLTDAIVLINGMATPEMAKRCRLAKVAGQIHISSSHNLHEMCISPVWGNPDHESSKELPTSCVITVSNEDGKNIRAQLSKQPDTAATLHAKVDTEWRKTPILVADLKAVNAPEDAPYVMFSGHHDTWYEGVMDNGSANATMLEVARCLVPFRDRMQRHLRFCFWSGHSQGRYSGSAWYADHNWHALEQDCAVHVNVDSTGGMGNTLLSLAPAATELSALAQDAISSHSEQNHQGARLARNSDQSFWGIGIPSLFGILSCQPVETPGVRNALGWWWHTPNDKIEHIDPDLLVRDTRIYSHALGRLLFEDVLPINVSAQVEDLITQLTETQLPSTNSVQLEKLIAEAEDLRKSIRRLEMETPQTMTACLRRDRIMMRLSRYLVPLDYTSGDRFSHDHALPLPKWPSLEPLRILSKQQPDTLAFHQSYGAATRCANRILSNLRQANALLRIEGSTL